MADCSLLEIDLCEEKVSTEGVVSAAYLEVFGLGVLEFEPLCSEEHLFLFIIHVGQERTKLAISSLGIQEYRSRT